MRTVYQSIVFLQCDGANEALEIYREQGADAAVEYLSQWDHGDRGEETDTLGAGTRDRTIEIGDYTLVVNTDIGYIGLSRKAAI